LLQSASFSISTVALKLQFFEIKNWQKWVDPSLSWNPNDFNGLEVTWLPVKAIWLPDIIIFNMYVPCACRSSVESNGVYTHYGITYGWYWRLCVVASFFSKRLEKWLD
jgi:hypothetical protein